MPRVLADTTVLYAAAYRRDSSHEAGLSVVRGIDDETLPEAVVLDYVLAETLNGLTAHAGHDAAVDFLDRIDENTRFHVESITSDARVAGRALFRRHEPLSFVDACIAASLRGTGLEYLYSFDDDFDAIEGVHRLGTAVNPYDPT